MMDKNSKEYFDSKQYWVDKRDNILKEIKPICEAFFIKDYDYIIDYNENRTCPREQLIIYDTKIGCTCNSINAVIDELLGYIFITRYCRNRSLGVFETQVKNVIKKYWGKEE